MTPEEKIHFGLTKEQKTGFVLLLVFAVLAVGLGILQIRNTIYGPFSLNKSIPLSVKEDLDPTATLKFRDTDKDGLNDFDEIYVYNTSAYLADSDSDGLSDKDEVGKGTDPLCAEGKSCEGPIMKGDVTITNGVTSSTLAANGIDSSAAETQPVDLATMLQDPVQVRKMLIDAGMDATVLDTISDSDLLIMVAEMLNSTSTLQTLENINNLLPATASSTKGQ